MIVRMVGVPNPQTKNPSRPMTDKWAMAVGAINDYLSCQWLCSGDHSLPGGASPGGTSPGGGWV